MAQGGSGAYVAYGLHFVQVVMVAHRVELAKQVVQHRHQLLSPQPPIAPDNWSAAACSLRRGMAANYHYVYESRAHCKAHQIVQP